MSFGSIKTGGMIEQATEQVLATWLPSYLAEAVRQAGHTEPDPWPPPPRAIETFAAFTTWDELALPAVIVVSPGTDGEPRRDGRGEWSAWWRLGVWVVVGASTQDHTRRLAHLYGAATRVCLINHHTLGGVASRTDWVGETYDTLNTDTARTVGAVGVDFRVEMRDVAGHGPTVMPPDPPDPHLPWPPDPMVTTTHIQTTGEAPT